MSLLVKADIDAKIADHAALATGIHGVGALNVAGFHSAGGEVSKVVWKDASEQAVADLNRTTDLAYTDLDLSAYVSANAKFAILQLGLWCNSIAAFGRALVGVRKNGTTPTYRLFLFLDNDRGDLATADKETMVVIALDANKVIEYQMDKNGTINFTTFINVMGYIE